MLATSLSVFISVDMEGIAGITTVRQCRRGTDDYSWARELMTDEANAAIEAAFDATAARWWSVIRTPTWATCCPTAWINAPTSCRERPRCRSA